MSGRLLLGYAGLTVLAIILAGVLGAGIRIITQDTPSPQKARTSAHFYVIKRGDGLDAIAERTGISEERLMELNPSIDPLALVPGQRIRLRPATPAERVRARRRRRALPRRYVVKAGDTPSGIAAKAGVPLFRLYELNRGIDRKPLVPGQRLRLRK